MLIRDLEKEAYEYDEVTICKDLCNDEWNVVKDGYEVIRDDFITHGEAFEWAKKVSRTATPDIDEYCKELNSLLGLLSK